ncbi:MAG: 2Fe-2S iron-sulfur cluster-binding protein [Acidimicrobiia bacterium]|nr:2Fe-2S iron-sulfur cluster-binding protein [Acidimicrobiia bacterium]MDH3398288.1 2Fe-2S iron-sulfur cluster-binding protein [Acidimicrobiia bacterium]
MSGVVITVDGRPVETSADLTILETCREEGLDIPTLCFLENLTPANTCRICVVEIGGSRALVPACSRRVESGMQIKTESERVRHTRMMVLELLGSSVDLSLTPLVDQLMDRYGAAPDRFDGGATVEEAPTIDNQLFVRDYAKCILCYKCVQACGVDAQNTFAISVVGRGFEARIATEYQLALPDSACVFCGNCFGVCPTGALIPTTEYEMRAAGTWDEDAQTVTRTICPYCGVGCNLDLVVQDNRILKALSPLDHDVTSGHLCIKGRFGWQHVQSE